MYHKIPVLIMGIAYSEVSYVQASSFGVPSLWSLVSYVNAFCLLQLVWSLASFTWLLLLQSSLKLAVFHIILLLKSSLHEVFQTILFLKSFAAWRVQTTWTPEVDFAAKTNQIDPRKQLSTNRSYPVNNYCSCKLNRWEARSTNQHGSPCAVINNK